MKNQATASSEHSDQSYPPVEFIPGNLAAGVLFLCDHASNALPAAYGTLGLSASELTRHIAYDIGAADVTRALAQAFEAPAVLTTFSRLLIDPNRGVDDPTLVMRLSDGAIIPGNVAAGPAEIQKRIKLFWQPYRSAVSGLIDDMQGAGPPPALVSIHSFTASWRDNLRPWEVGLLWDNDPRLARRFLLELERQTGLSAGDNQPYDGALIGDTMNEHGTMRGLAHVLIELRQDLIDDPQKASQWAQRLAGPLAVALKGDDIHVIKHHGSRARTGHRPALRDNRAGEENG